MGLGSLFQKQVLTLVLSLTAICFGVGFILSYQDERARYDEMGHLAQDHLTYAVQLKDDMSVIDWAKDLEKVDGILVFQATEGTKLLAEGGNRDRLPSFIDEGTFYQFPFQWNYHSTFHIGGTTGPTLTVVFRTKTGPLFWGLCMASASFITALILGLWRSGTTIAPRPATSLDEEHKVKPPIKGLEPVFAHMIQPDSHAIFIDRHYVVQEATPQAASTLGRGTAELIGMHLLDLLPGPGLVQAIESAQEAKVPGAFPSCPTVSVLLRPAGKGTLLILNLEG
jgi:hypothetical protein